MRKPILNLGMLQTLQDIAEAPLPMNHTMTTFTGPLYRQGLICKYYLGDEVVWGLTDAGRAALEQEGDDGNQ